MSEPNTSPKEFLTFSLGGEEYAIDILKVQEIRRFETVTRIANAPSFIKGVVNLRGTIVPIVDLRVKFALGEARYDDFTVVIVLNIGKRVIGAVVDAVSEVVTLGAHEVHAAPEFATLDTKYLTGLATYNERMLIVLDIERLMTSSEMALVEQAAA
ncbi:MAG: chemotaxis protein CheW [Betaproteobacteria bacterium]|nr:chemotaxis protein CheW [Betaproteobacteria bacterium]